MAASGGRRRRGEAAPSAAPAPAPPSTSSSQLLCLPCSATQITFSGSGCAASLRPDAPRDLRAEPGDGYVVLTWRGPANGACVDEYQVTAVPLGSQSRALGAGAPQTTRQFKLRVEGLQNGQVGGGSRGSQRGGGGGRGTLLAPWPNGSSTLPTTAAAAILRLHPAASRRSTGSPCAPLRAVPTEAASRAWTPRRASRTPPRRPPRCAAACCRPRRPPTSRCRTFGPPRSRSASARLPTMAAPTRWVWRRGRKGAGEVQAGGAERRKLPNPALVPLCLPPAHAVPRQRAPAVRLPRIRRRPALLELQRG